MNNYWAQQEAEARDEAMLEYLHGIRDELRLLRDDLHQRSLAGRVRRIWRRLTGSGRQDSDKTTT